MNCSGKSSAGFTLLRSNALHKQNILPPQEGKNKGKKTLVLDLDETLVHSSFQPVDNVDIVLPVCCTSAIFNRSRLMARLTTCMWRRDLVQKNS